jgi:uncharacterized protein
MHYVLTLLIAALTFFIGVSDAVAQRAKKKTKAAPAQSQRHMLWRMQTDSTVVYLMGSVHMLPKSYYPLDTILERSLDSSDVLVLEVKLDEGTSMAVAQQMMTSAMLQDGQSLSTIVSKKTYDQAKSRLKKNGLDIAMFEPFEPWALALTVMGLELKSSGFSGEHGVDVHFSERAAAESKVVDGLETVEDQLRIFDSMSPETQEEFLKQTLNNRDETSAMLKDLASAWRRGDVKTLEKLALAQMKNDSTFYEKMLVGRNQAWMPKIEAMLNTSGKRYLVVVGAAHLVGADGIIEMLRAKGYDPVQM